VHSLKDLPVEERDGLVIAAIPARAEARDVLVSAGGATLAALADGARVGTSSLRRSAQLRACRPDLKVEPLRGNVDTRLRKVQAGEYDAILLSGAGLLRLGLEGNVTEWLSLEVMLPAPGQGALAVQCRAGDEATCAALAALDDPATRRATTAERAFLAGLGGGCSLPVAAYAETDGDGLLLRGLVASPDGRQVIRCQARGGDPQETGLACARQALARGAGRYLDPSPAGRASGEAQP
jgi:hydroxymethylbilane synthase